MHTQTVEYKNSDPGSGSHANQLRCVRSQGENSDLTLISADVGELTVNHIVALFHVFYITLARTCFEFSFSNLNYCEIPPPFFFFFPFSLSPTSAFIILPATVSKELVWHGGQK